MHQHDGTGVHAIFIFDLQSLLDHGHLTLELDQLGEGISLLTDIVLDACHVVKVMGGRVLDELHPVEFQ